MSWNEPKRDRDPWEKGSGGAPDLDEMLRRLRARLARGLKRRPGSPPRRNPIRLWWLVPLVLIVIWLATGFFQVPAGSKAVNLRLGAYTGMSGPGLHWHLPWPFAGAHVVDVSERRSVGQRASVLTRDGKLATIELAVRYRVSDPYDYIFGTVQPTRVLAALASDALATAARDYSLEELRGKDQYKIETTLEVRIADALAGMHAGVEVNGVDIKRIALPPEVEAAAAHLAAAHAHAAAAASAAHAAAAKELVTAHARADEIVATAAQARLARIARAQSEVTRFETLIPTWQNSPAATRELLSEDARTDILTAAPKIVVAGSIRSVQIPGWPTPVAATSGAPVPTTAKKPAKSGGKSK
ncbi:MAG: protease modulator HflK [Gammaproteobacteria bacterium]